LASCSFRGIGTRFDAELYRQHGQHVDAAGGLQHYSFAYQTFWPQVMAGSMIVILPILVIYIFAQRYFIEGVASTGVKG
jgi:ABC-type glycerol-3-phosphate transport system permease component